ncbi:hypothetical protein LBMAG05_05310 [Actinomycetes bacterium]|nr:hypothetical protein LBMAG05_05310 [Actinomycetes bacterium]
MKRSLILVLSMFLTFIVAPSAKANVSFDGDVSCPADFPIKYGESNANGSYKTVCHTDTYHQANLIGGDVFQNYVNSGGTLDISQVITQYRREQQSISDQRANAEAQALAEANANPGQEVCKTWSYTSTFNGSGGGGTCVTIPLAARKIDNTVAANKIAEIRSQLEADPQYATLRYGIGNQTFDYTPAERAALLDQWAANMAGNELAKSAASKKAAKNPGLRVCSDWVVGSQNGQQCDYVPVALTSKAILASVTEQLDGLELTAALDKKVNKFVKAVDVAIPNTTSAKTVTIPKAPKGMSQVVTVENPDDCSAKGRKVKIDKGALCEISIALTVAAGIDVNFAQTIKRN